MSAPDFALRGKLAYKADDAPMREAWARAREIVPESWINMRLAEAMRKVETWSAHYGNPAYLWSGGKDAMVLRYVCQSVGVDRGYFCWCKLDWQPHRAFCVQFDGIEWLEQPLFTEAWLVRNPKYLWPREPADAQRFLYLHHKDYALDAFARGKHGIMFRGGRAQDKNPPYNPERPSRSGFRCADPIYDWTHEEVMAAIQYRDLPLSPAYDLPLGWYDGPYPWCGWTAGSWEVMREHAPDVYYRMRHRFP